MKLQKFTQILLASILFFFASSCFSASPLIPRAKNGDVNVCSWNIENMGKSKDDEEIGVMANILRDCDAIGIMEVSTSQAGANAVARLADELSRKGDSWDYIVSDSTIGAGPERYTYVFKKSKVQVNRRDAYLIKDLENSIDREPYRITFVFTGWKNPVSMHLLHAVPTAKDPITEIEAVAKWGGWNKEKSTLLTGDFNLPASATDEVLLPKGFTSHIQGLPTALKNKLGKDGEYLGKEYDHIYSKGVKTCGSGVIDFPAAFFSPITQDSLKKAGKISDHIPVWVCLSPDK